ncbi:monooxygenase [uncultured Photobacterium sp.]|uniref:monooxygenase n=1 Tax=uncultured Photobacterium sp. TaxID=173973 RepID=UPI00260C0F66|nr:monooxygenase [uncultured Photobacterium sp.]
MRKLLQVDFNYQGPFGTEMSEQLKELAESINHEPGMIWKIWTESEKELLGGGIYFFENEETAQAYLKMHSERLQKMGITNIRGVVFDFNENLSLINKGPVYQ